MKILAGILGVCFLASAITGCSTTKSSSAANMESRVQALETKVSELEMSSRPSSSSYSMPSSSTTEDYSSGIDPQSLTQRQIQKALKNAGYYDGEIDGKIGSKTKAAITQFQRDMGLQADGIAGSKTKEKLVKYL